MKYLILSIIVAISFLTGGISFGQTSSINCDGYTITHNISKIIIYSCERFHISGTVYTANQNSIDLKTNGEGGHLELNIPKSLMAEIYQVNDNHNTFSFLNWNLQKSETDYNIISIEIPDKVGLITIFGSEPHYEIGRAHV